MIYYEGLEEEKNIQKAIKLLEEAAYNGNLDAQCQLGIIW